MWLLFGLYNIPRFNPRPRVGGYEIISVRSSACSAFQSTPPCRGLRDEIASILAQKQGFNPRPRVGGYFKGV